jgi:hypothetical protein
MATDTRTVLTGALPAGSLLGGGLSFKAQVLMLGAMPTGYTNVISRCIREPRAGSSDRQQIARNAEGRAAGRAA